MTMYSVTVHLSPLRPVFLYCSSITGHLCILCVAAEVLASPVGGEGPGEMGFRETKMADPNKARQAERLGMGVGRVG